MTDISGFETIEFDVSGHVATLTLNRPEKLNSFNERMADEVAAAWRRVREDEDIRVAIIQANGERAFCTGIDVRGPVVVPRTDFQPGGSWRTARPQGALGVEASDRGITWHGGRWRNVFR